MRQQVLCSFAITPTDQTLEEVAEPGRVPDGACGLFVMVRNRPPYESLPALRAGDSFTDADHREPDGTLVAILDDRLTFELSTSPTTS